MSAQQPNAQKPWYKHPYLWLVILLPALAVGVSLWFVSMAFLHQDDMVRDDWYMDGKTLQQDLSRDTAAVTSNIHATLSLHPDGTLLVHIDGKAGTNLPALLWLNFYHPTHAKQDQHMTLRATDVAGQYSGTLAALPTLKGRYHLELEDGNLWRLQDDIHLPFSKMVLRPQAVVH
jgi:hypothetical protein